MTIESRILESRVYLGGGTYSALQPTITPDGRAAGWQYTYPIGINQNGVKFRDLGHTLDTLESVGVITLVKQHVTAF